MYSHGKWKFSDQHDMICWLVTTSSVDASQAKLPCSCKDHHKLEQNIGKKIATTPSGDYWGLCVAENINVYTISNRGQSY
jgi:hypothetical protein